MRNDSRKGDYLNKNHYLWRFSKLFKIGELP
ncbi:MAG: hypothetical protein ACI8YQ_002755 [Polaribacter sp.]|jgi:hypothetical protein